MFVDDHAAVPVSVGETQQEALDVHQRGAHYKLTALVTHTDLRRWGTVQEQQRLSTKELHLFYITVLQE